MLPQELNIDRDRLEKICRKYGVARLEVFGSFSRGDAGPDSDLDVLVTFQKESCSGLEFVAFQQELQTLFARSVDLFSRLSVERSPNKYFRHFVLQNVQPLYDCA